MDVFASTWQQSIAWLAGAAAVGFYFLIIGVLELPIAIVSLAVFLGLALFVWNRPEERNAARHDVSAGGASAQEKDHAS